MLHKKVFAWLNILQGVLLHFARCVFQFNFQFYSESFEQRNRNPILGFSRNISRDRIKQLQLWRSGKLNFTYPGKLRQPQYTSRRTWADYIPAHKFIAAAVHEPQYTSWNVFQIYLSKVALCFLTFTLQTTWSINRTECSSSRVLRRHRSRHWCAAIYALLYGPIFHHLFITSLCWPGWQISSKLQHTIRSDVYMKEIYGTQISFLKFF